MFSFGNLGIIFNGASAQLFFAQGEILIRLGQRSPTGQWRQRLIDADCEPTSLKLEVAPVFCYLGDYLSSDGGCELAFIARCRGANATSRCPYSHPAHSPSPPEEELAFRATGASCSMQVKPGPQPLGPLLLTWINFNLSMDNESHAW